MRSMEPASSPSSSVVVRLFCALVAVRHRARSVAHATQQRRIERTISATNATQRAPCRAPRVRCRAGRARPKRRRTRSSAAATLFSISFVFSPIHHVPGASTKARSSAASSASAAGRSHLRQQRDLVGLHDTPLVERPRAHGHRLFDLRQVAASSASASRPSMRNVFGNPAPSSFVHRLPFRRHPRSRRRAPRRRRRRADRRGTCPRLAGNVARGSRERGSSVERVASLSARNREHAYKRERRRIEHGDEQQPCADRRLLPTERIELLTTPREPQGSAYRWVG